MLAISDEEFEAAVVEGIDAVPPELAEAMDNVAIIVEDDSPADEPELLGLYVGVPLTERDEWYAGGSLPDHITIFRNPILRRCRTTAEVREQVTITVVHEIAHHFGIDDDRLHELGWG